MTESAETREKTAKGITDKEAAKSELSNKKVDDTEKEKGDFADIDAIHQLENTLHGAVRLHPRKLRRPEGGQGAGGRVPQEREGRAAGGEVRRRLLPGAPALRGRASVCGG